MDKTLVTYATQRRTTAETTNAIAAVLREIFPLSIAVINLKSRNHGR